jgi:lysozyme
MTPRHQVSRTAIELIKRFEGYRRNAAQLPDGRWTIGYGHTLTARQGAEVSEADAEALLLYDMIGVAHTVSELTYASLTRNQFDAMCAFAFSIGLEAFRGSDVLKRVNEGALIQAAFALELWRKAEFEGERIVVDAMVRRRAAEKLLFLTPPDDQWRAIPSAVLKPLLDELGPDTAPRGPPVEVSASLDGEAAAVARDEVALESEPESRVTAAAEAVAARLQTLFPDPEPEPEILPPSPLGEPAALDAEAPAPIEPASVEPEPEPEPAVEAEPEAEAEAELPLVEAEPAEPVVTPAPRIIIDDTAPYEFVPATVQPIDGETGDGLLAVVSLIILGLAFFAGGVFWALNAQPDVRPTVFTPLLVGWLAGVAGVGFIAVAVFLLLQRVTRAADRRDGR